MNVLDYTDYTLAFGQGLLAILLWHKAEPRLLEMRGRWQAICAMALGFVLALSFPIAFSRPLAADGPMHWQLTVRDFCLVLYAACLYRHAMTVKPREA